MTITLFLLRVMVANLPQELTTPPPEVLISKLNRCQAQLGLVCLGSLFEKSMVLGRSYKRSTCNADSYNKGMAL